MSKKNYSKFYNSEAKEPIVEEVKEPIAEAIVETEEVVEEPVEKKPVNKPVYGYVNDCSRLNIRKAPNINSAPLCVVDVNTKLVINESNSTADWYSVVTPSGVEGYCMRKFVRTK